jgi:hypothetical protein
MLGMIISRHQHHLRMLQQQRKRALEIDFLSMLRGRQRAYFTCGAGEFGKSVIVSYKY